MSTISRLTGWLLTFCGVAILALIGLLWLDGTNVVTTAGQAWSEFHPLSLNEARHLAMIHLGFDAWNGSIAAMLRQPAWLALAEMSGLTLILGILFLLLGQTPQPAESDEARPA